MEIWSEIRREILTGALSKRAAIAKHGVGRHTLKKMLAHDEPPRYRQAGHSIVVATDLPLENRTEVQGSEWLAGAGLDRLTHRCHIRETNR